MNDFSIAAKFLFVIGTVVILLSATRSLGHLTYKMAEAAMNAQQQQMSYGKFSRQLWSKHKDKARPVRQ